VSAGTQGFGNLGHLTGILVQKLTNTRFQFVPYRGSTPAIQDLVAGQIDICFDSPFGTLPQLRSGSIKAYAVTAKSRLAVAPNIPTVDEAGLVGFYISNWRGLLGGQRHAQGSYRQTQRGCRGCLGTSDRTRAA
jgi:tripartite-type tricarboxylate transporter receptor subunit TctC